MDREDHRQQRQPDDRQGKPDDPLDPAGKGQRKSREQNGEGIVTDEEVHEGTINLGSGAESGTVAAGDGFPDSGMASKVWHDAYKTWHRHHEFNSGPMPELLPRLTDHPPGNPEYAARVPAPSECTAATQVWVLIVIRMTTFGVPGGAQSNGRLESGG